MPTQHGSMRESTSNIQTEKQTYRKETKKKLHKVTDSTNNGAAAKIKMVRIIIKSSSNRPRWPKGFRVG
jgi:hypothetical protein